MTQDRRETKGTALINAVMAGCDAVLQLAAVVDVNQVTLDAAFAEKIHMGTIPATGPPRPAPATREICSGTARP